MEMSDVLATPPVVHVGAEDGVWSAERSLYEFLAQHAQPEMRTLETGLGVSTALFALWATEHVCVVGDGAQVERITNYAQDHEIDLSGVDFKVGFSDQVLPKLDRPLDLVLIDGGHGYPMPIIDWYFTALHLVQGGIVVVDDTHLPSVRNFLGTFLDADPRWDKMASGDRWVAYRKTEPHNVREEWTQQDFLGGASVRLSTRVKVTVNRLVPGLRRRLVR